MKEKKISSKQLTKIAVIALVAVLVILGGTYAWLRIGLGANNTNIIKAGALDLIIDETPTEGAEVRLERAIPQSYRQGITNQPYRFTLINNSTIDTDYTISLEDLYEGADASLTTNDKIADNLIRYILVKNDDEMIATNSKLLSTGRTIDAGTIAGKVGNNPTEIPYTLYIWIDSMAGEDETEADIMSKIFNARLSITAEQHHASTGPTKVAAQPGDTHKGIVYLNPTNLTTTCGENNSQIGTGVENGSGCMRFYIYDDSGDTYKMLLDHNTTPTVAWASHDDYIEAGGTEEDWSDYKMNKKGPVTATKQLNIDTSGWIGSPRLITAYEVATIVGYSSFNGQYQSYFSFDATDPEKHDRPEYDSPSPYAWLYNYTYECVEHGCSVSDESTYGYWTSTGTIDSPSDSFYVEQCAGVDNYANTDYDQGFGIRPVITINKSMID